MPTQSDQEPQPGQVQMTKAKPPEKPVEINLGDIIENPKGNMSTEARAQREFYGTQPLVRIIIPKTSEEPTGAAHGFCVNGYSFMVRKGCYVNVPEPVADLIGVSYEQSESVLRDNEFNLKNNRRAAQEFARG